MKRKKTGKTPESEEDTDLMITLLAVKLWNEYWNETTQSGEDGKKAAKMYAKMFNVAENSTAAIMFQTFTGGLTKGMELYEKEFAGADDKQH